MSSSAETVGVARAAPLLGWVALGVVYLVWGSTYLAIRVGDESIPPLVMAGIRYLVAAGLLAPFAVRGARRRAGAPGDDPVVSWRPSRRQVAGAATVGVLLLAGGNGGVSVAERSLPSGLAALLIAAVPLWMVIGDRVLTRRRPSAAVVGALLAGFVGIALLSQLSHAGGAPAAGSAVGVILFAGVAWATGSLVGSRVAQPATSLLATTVQMAAGGLVLLVVAAASGELAGFHPAAVSGRSWVAFAYLVGPGSILGLTCYVTALRLLPTSIVATYGYVNPVIAVLLGWAVLGESVTAITALGGALVLGGVALLVADQRRQPGPDRPPR